MDRQLTKGSDKLAAIDGLGQATWEFLARSGQSQYKIDTVGYHAGLLLDGVSTQLKWWPSADSRISTIARAPSWSWACWDGQIYMANGRHHSTVRKPEFLLPSNPVCVKAGAPFGALRLNGSVTSYELKRAEIKEFDIEPEAVELDPYESYNLKTLAT
ncbi:hypothetical protein K491DRAFT_722798 [Lophiostoma macrostomum CBS 122681]|uniref:Uncharacterized protein n=1 Tax=Lophiostoma macrostomum CBS 122681 TaxID=1314788 RepID=A0A6A6SNI7_9PLEO|nr:hypothetical protein K491DRAFT_722798 [Lophiostoma macrostomum CBS 122681]